MFRKGAVPFIGDYIDLTMFPTIKQNTTGAWVFNTEPSDTSGGYAVWTDNRNVRPAPLSGLPIGSDGQPIDYTPPEFATRPATSRVIPGATLPQCNATLTGTRNQDIFGARFDQGLFAAALGNAKRLGTVQRGFALLLENTTTVTRSYRLTILGHPDGGEASFRQFGPPVMELDVAIPRLSSAARTLYAASTNPLASIVVDVSEIVAPGGALVSGGLHSSILINADRSTPAIENPAIENPAIENKDIAAVEVYNPRINPAIENPAIENSAIRTPAIENPAIENVTIANKAILTPAIENPAIENPAIENKAMENPAIENFSLANGSISDTTWELTNDGNTTAVYAVKLLLNQAVPNGILTQLIVHQNYTTPAAAPDCELKVQLHSNVLVNITSPSFSFQNPAQPAIENSAVKAPAIENPAIENATIALAPGETAFVTVRAFDPDKNDQITFEPAAAVTPAAVAQSVNTEVVAELPPGAPPPTPPAAVSTTIAVPELDDALFLSGNYGEQLYASVDGTWSIVAGALPIGVTLAPTGVFSGVPTTPGVYSFTVQFTTSSVPAQSVTRDFTVNIAEPLGIVTSALPEGVTSYAYAAALNAIGGVDPKRWTITSGALPAGLALNQSTGVIAGTPLASGPFTFTVQVQDSASTQASASALLSLTVSDPADFERTWVGASNDWNDPANWSPNGVPGPGDDVLLVGPSVFVLLTTDISVRSLVLLDGATIDSNGHTITVNGSVQAGHTIEGTGTVVMTGTGTLSGEVPNLEIAAGASVTLIGSVHVTGDLTLRSGLALAGYDLQVDGLLVVPSGLPVVPGIARRRWHRHRRRAVCCGAGRRQRASDGWRWTAAALRQRAVPELRAASDADGDREPRAGRTDHVQQSGVPRRADDGCVHRRDRFGARCDAADDSSRERAGEQRSLALEHVERRDRRLGSSARRSRGHQAGLDRSGGHQWRAHLHHWRHQQRSEHRGQHAGGRYVAGVGELCQRERGLQSGVRRRHLLARRSRFGRERGRDHCGAAHGEPDPAEHCDGVLEHARPESREQHGHRVDDGDAGRRPERRRRDRDPTVACGPCCGRQHHLHRGGGQCRSSDGNQCDRHADAAGGCAVHQRERSNVSAACRHGDVHHPLA